MPITTLTVITGSVYNEKGVKLTSGRLYLKPKSFIRNGNDLVIPTTVSYDIPATGIINLGVSPSSDSVVYIVEFDPNPADTSVPFRLKSGYFKNEWTIPSSGPIDITML